MSGHDDTVAELPYLVRYWGHAAGEFSWIHMYPHGEHERYQPVASATAHGVEIRDEDAVDRERLRTEIATIAAMIAANADARPGDPREDPGRWATHELNTGWAPHPRFKPIQR
ncbi:MAG: hypothetical protein ACTII7_07680 [Galactobacter sp.]